MLLELLFSAYIVLLLLVVVILGLNYFKIRDKSKVNPQMIVFLIPFVFNYILAKTIFFEINPLFTTLAPCLFIFFIGRKLRNVRLFGLTGGIATGKSTLTKNMINNLPKLAVIDCDQITKDLRDVGEPGYKLIIKLLGDKAEQFMENNTKQIKREQLSKYVFDNPAFRRQLTAKMGKLIMWQIAKKVLKNIWSSHNLIMIDAPILYESKVLQYFCYPIIVVGCSQQKQIQRLLKRNKYNRDQALSRIRSQMPLQVKQKKSDIYIKNEGTEEELLQKTLAKLNKFLSKKV